MAVATRFGLVLGGLMMWPFPVKFLPGGYDAASLLGRPLAWLTQAIGHGVLGVERVDAASGSGDRLVDYLQLAVIVALAVLITGGWSALDRRRVDYPRLRGALWVALRYYVAFNMFVYGMSKLLLQFGTLSAAELAQPVGDLSPMRLLWTFMAYSPPYAMFGGLAELVGGALLVWRRTATLGALVVAAVMTNVVMLNLSYDVPVKLFSTQLLVMALVVAWPGLRRLVTAALGQPVGGVAARPRRSRRWELARGLAKLAILGCAAWTVYATTRRPPEPADTTAPLTGSWDVAQLVIGGVEHPPLITDRERWRFVVFERGQLWLGTMTGQVVPIDVEVHADDHTLVLIRRDDSRATWTFSQPADDRAILDGVGRDGRTFHVELHRKPAPFLLTRGFHWISEEPANY